MTSSHRSTMARAGVVALLTAGGLVTAAAPAHAADQADLALVPLSTQLARGVTDAKAKPFKFTVDNSRSTVDAKGVTAVVDTSNLKKNKVGYLVPDGCEVTGDTFTCLLGDLAAGTSEDFGLPLFSTGGKGPAGTLTVTIRSATADPEQGDNSADVNITVTRPGYDLTTWVQDVHADVVVDGDEAGETGLKPVRPGGTAPLDWAVFNDGSRPATGVFYGITLPAGVTFAELPKSCAEQEIGGLAQALCEDRAAVLAPGEYYTDTVRVKVDAGVTEPVLRVGNVFAYGLDAATGGDPAEDPKVASQAQRRTFDEVDEGDNSAVFDVFVDLSAEPTPAPSGEPTGTPTAAPSPSTTPGTGGNGGGAGDGGGLPVTGVQAGLIGGVGGAVLLAGGALLLLSRRRRVVLVTPGDETSTD